MSKPRMASSPRATYVTIRVPSAMRSLPICRGPARLVHAVGAPHAVLERPGTVMVGGGGAALECVADAAHAVAHAGGGSGHEHALHARARRQPRRDVAELRRKVRVDEEDLHGPPHSGQRVRGCQARVLTAVAALVLVLAASAPPASAQAVFNTDVPPAS